MKKINLVLVLAFLVLVGCGGKNGEKTDTGEDWKSSITPISLTKYDIPAGADPSVPAELGGEGFSGEGWETAVDYNYTGDPSAIKGGYLTAAIGDYPSTLRAYGKDANITTIQFFNECVYEKLLYLDPETLEYIPGLATHWQVSEDKMTYRFRIDPDARWSDGMPVTADDVVYTWRLLVDEGIVAPYTNIAYNSYEEPVAESKYIVRIKCKELNWRLFYRFTDINILPKHYLEKIDGKTYLEKYQYNMMPGTGPYIVDSKLSKKGHALYLRRRSDYWAENKRFNIGKNNFNLMEFLVIRDNVLEKEKFKKGEIDIYSVGRAQWWVNEFDSDDKSFDELYRGLIQKRKIFNYLPKGVGGLVFNLRKPPFDDIRVRKAFAMLWNRKQLIEKLFFNEYLPMHSAFPGSVYENPDNFIATYNPDEANRLLDKAGWDKRNDEGIRMNDNGELLEVTLSILQSLERIYTPYQEDLRKAGFKLNLKITDANSLLKIGDERRFKVVIENWSGSLFPNPESMYHSKTADPDNTSNTSGIKNSRIDELCELYKVSFKQSERIEILREMDKIITETVNWAYSWYSPYAERMCYWNKFSMPKSYLSKYGGNAGVYVYWWYDDKKADKLEKAKSDKSITFSKEPQVIDYWNVLKK